MRPVKNFVLSQLKTKLLSVEPLVEACKFFEQKNHMQKFCLHVYNRPYIGND